MSRVSLGCHEHRGWCPGIAKHHGRYSKSDHLCQDGEEWTSRRKRLRRRIFVKYAVEISDLPLFSSRDVCKNKGYRIIRGKQCHSVNKCILFEITRMQSVNRRIAVLFYALVMKVLKVRPGVRRKKGFHRQISAARTTRYYNAFFIFKLKLAWKSCVMSVIVQFGSSACGLPFTWANRTVHCLGKW